MWLKFGLLWIISVSTQLLIIKIGNLIDLWGATDYYSAELITKRWLHYPFFQVATIAALISPLTFRALVGSVLLEFLLDGKREIESRYTKIMREPWLRPHYFVMFGTIVAWVYPLLFMYTLSPRLTSDLQLDIFSTFAPYFFRFGFPLLLCGFWEYRKSFPILERNQIFENCGGEDSV